ncbi:MAG TPA: glucosaminidase domain-containing protein [Chitinophagaceae bacterium]|nr:glucosaminidase domain-containing protein [Chitinophagaceae bacterium]
MRRIFLAAALLCFAASAFSQTAYVKKYKHLALELSGEYGIPASVILGIAIHESGAGSSRNAKLLNNHFGIVGKNKLLKEKGIRSAYKQYDDVKDSYKDFCNVIRRKRFYETLRGESDYRKWVDAISKAGYSVIPETWKHRVLETIRRSEL